MFKRFLFIFGFCFTASFLSAAQSGTVTAGWGSISWTTDNVARQWHFTSTVGSPTGGSSVGVDGILKTVSGSTIAYMYAISGNGTQFVTRVFSTSISFDDHPDGVNIYVRYQSGGTTQSYQNGYTDPAPADTQTVTISPENGSMTTADSFMFTADGAQGGNAYSWSVEPGGANLAWKGEGKQALFRASKDGTYTVKVWAQAGNGYDRSNDAIATILVTKSAEPDNTAIINFDNRSRDYAVTFRVYQDGDMIFEIQVPAGQLISRKVELRSDSPYTVTVVTKDPVLNPDGTWSEGEEKEEVVGTFDPTEGQPADATPEDPENTPPTEEPTGDPQEAIEAEGTAMAKLIASAALAQAETLQTKVGEVTDRFGRLSPGTIPVPSSPPSDSISLGTHGGKQLAILKNPFSPSGPFGGSLYDLAALVKRIIGWSAVAGFYLWLLKTIHAGVSDALKTPGFAGGISSAVSRLVAGLGGLASVPVRMGMSLAVVTLLLGLPIAIYTASTVGLPFTSIRNMATFGIDLSAAVSSGSTLSAAYALSYFVVPWDVLFFIPVWAFLVRVGVFSSQTFWQLFMKLANV